MNKLLKGVLVCAVGLLASPVVFGATTATTSPATTAPMTTEPMTEPASGPSMSTTEGPTTTVAPAGTTVTVVKTGPMGYNVCYRPMSRRVQASRIIQRCGYHGCQAFRVTRTFDVTVYSNCHVQVGPCSPNGFARFGFYPTKQEARYAVDRCQHTIGGQVPTDWRVMY